MNKIISYAPAKINLYLDITAKRHDGYHDISTVMTSVDLRDRISVERSHVTEVLCDRAVTEDPHDNIAYRAARLFSEYYGEDCPVNICIEKKIPAAAGLAGGSTDAAAVLRSMNALFGTGFSEKKLCEIGRRLGADVPYCITGGTALAEGIGEILTPFPAMPDCTVLIAADGEGVSTAEAYTEADRLGPRTGGHDTEKLKKALEDGDLALLSSACYNIFERAIIPLRPRVSALKELFIESGALFTQMSGSGPSVFAIYDDEETALQAYNALGTKCREIYLTHPIKARRDSRNATAPLT